MLAKLVALSLAPGLVIGGKIFSSTFTSSMDPFSLCNYKSPSSGTIESQTLHLYFDESDYDGSRDDRGVEICVFENGTKSNVAEMKKEGWQGFNLYVPSAGFPTNKHTIIAQQFCPAGCSSWCGTLEIAKNSLVTNYRSSCGNAVINTIVDDISRDEWHSVVIRMRVSTKEDGAYEMWWDGDKVYSSTGINVGFGTWTSDTIEEGWYFKNGMYAYDHDSYTDATRSIVLDNVKWYQTDDGDDDGYETVAP